MSLNIGTLIGYLQLDDTNFERKADAADRKINALKLHLQALAKENPKISVEVAAQTAALDDLKVRLADLKTKAAEGVDIRVDAVEALIDLDRVQQKVRDLHGKTITIDADTAPAEAKLHSLGAMWTSILGLGPTLLPLSVAAAGAFGAIGSSATSAAAGIGVLKLALAGMGGAISAYGSYQSAILKATGARRLAMQQATTPAQRQAAQQGFQTATTAANATLSASSYGQLGPRGQRFARFAGGLLAPGGAVFKLRQSAQNAVLPGLTAGIKNAEPALPTIDKTVSSVGHAVGSEVAQAGKALSSPFWLHFFNFLGKEAPKDIKLMGDAFGHTIQGIVRGLERFAPQGRSLLEWVDEGAKKFDGWTGGKGFTQFMSDVQTDGKAALGVIQPLAVILPALLGGLNSTGVGELNTIGLVLKGMAALPTGVLSDIGTFLPIIVIGIKAVALATKVWAAAQWLLNAAVAASPLTWVLVGLAALAIALVLAYKHSATFRTIVHAALRDVGVAAQWLWNDAIKPAFAGISAAIEALGRLGRWLWNSVFQPVFHFIASGVATLLSLFAKMLGALSHVPGFGWVGDLAQHLNDAANKARELADAINQIPTHKTATIDVVRVVHGVVHGTGGHVPNDPGIQQHASGGFAFGAGTTTSDSILSRLSNGEFVVRAAQAAANAPLLQAINNGSGRVSLASAGAARGGYHGAAMPARFALTITNWDEGTGHIEAIASDSHAADHRYATAVGRN